MKKRTPTIRLQSGDMKQAHKHTLTNLQLMYNALPASFRKKVAKINKSDSYVSAHSTPSGLDPDTEEGIWSTAYVAFERIRARRTVFKERQDHWAKPFEDRNCAEVVTALAHRDMEWPSHGDFRPEVHITVCNTPIVHKINDSYQNRGHWHIEVPLTYARKPELHQVPLQWLQRGGNKFACFITDIYDRTKDDQTQSTQYSCTFYAWNRSKHAESSVPREGTLLIYESESDDDVIGFGESLKKARSLLNRRLKARTMEALENAW